MYSVVLAGLTREWPVAGVLIRAGRRAASGCTRPHEQRRQLVDCSTGLPGREGVGLHSPKQFRRALRVWRVRVRALACLVIASHESRVPLQAHARRRSPTSTAVKWPPKASYRGELPWLPLTAPFGHRFAVSRDRRSESGVTAAARGSGTPHHPQLIRRRHSPAALSLSRFAPTGCTRLHLPPHLMRLRPLRIASRISSSPSSRRRTLRMEQGKTP